MLYVRIRPKFALPHEQRDRTFDYLKARPGATNSLSEKSFQDYFLSLFICVYLCSSVVSNLLNLLFG